MKRRKSQPQHQWVRRATYTVTGPSGRARKLKFSGWLTLSDQSYLCFREPRPPKRKKAR
jgi:hypothetical protein